MAPGLFHVGAFSAPDSFHSGKGARMRPLSRRNRLNGNVEAIHSLQFSERAGSSRSGNPGCLHEEHGVPEKPLQIDPHHIVMKGHFLGNVQTDIPVLEYRISLFRVGLAVLDESGILRSSTTTDTSHNHMGDAAPFLDFLPRLFREFQREFVHPYPLPSCNYYTPSR